MPQRPFLRLSVCLLIAVPLLATPPVAAAEPGEFAGITATHNQARRAVGVAALAWSEPLAAEAQQWADQLTREGCKLRYDPDPVRRETTGQNLFQAFGSTPYEGYKRTPVQAAARWVQGAAQYDHSAHRCLKPNGSECGAYLQVIWETTTALGCGRARCEAAEVWVCHYTPRGGQEGLKPFGNPAQSSVTTAPPPVQQCGWQGPSPAEQMIEALDTQLPQ